MDDSATIVGTIAMENGVFLNMKQCRVIAAAIRAQAKKAQKEQAMTAQLISETAGRLLGNNYAFAA